MTDAMTTSTSDAHPSRRASGRGRERGANLVEYALLLALIVVVCIGAVQLFGSSVPTGGMSSITSAL